MAEDQNTVVYVFKKRVGDNEATSALREVAEKQTIHKVSFNHMGSAGVVCTSQETSGKKKREKRKMKNKSNADPTKKAKRSKLNSKRKSLQQRNEMEKMKREERARRNRASALKSRNKRRSQMVCSSLTLFYPY